MGAVDDSIVLNEQPDIVISQQAERFIPRLPNDLTGPLNREIIDSKR
ncbi:MAG: hypothetical protein AAFQ63_15345 [Cyanobacteria bacterium J06621_11]